MRPGSRGKVLWTACNISAAGIGKFSSLTNLVKIRGNDCFMAKCAKPNIFVLVPLFRPMQFLGS